MNAIKRLLIVMNKVTACHRHGLPISKEALDEMCNAQIDAEKELQEIEKEFLITEPFREWHESRVNNLIKTDMKLVKIIE